MGKTAIEWTDHSVSPIRARCKATGKVFHFCERISPGCAHCYAATMAQRFGLPDYVKANRDKVEFFLDDSKLQSVLKRKKPTRYFWEDCSDLFGAWVPDEWIDACFAVMAATPQHTHQVLTKRAERMRAYIESRSRPSQAAAIELAARRMGRTLEFEGRQLYDWPLRNVWLGVSVEDQQRADERIPLLLQTPAAVRFLSCEPLLGPVSLAAWIGCQCPNDYPPPLGPHNQWCPAARDSFVPRLDWVIIGGESGRDARPCNLAWIRSLVAQCRGAGVACFVKQLGSVPLMDEAEWRAEPKTRLLRAHNHAKATVGTVPILLLDSKGGEMFDWPDDLHVREFPC